MTTKEFCLDLGQKIQSCVIADDKELSLKFTKIGYLSDVDKVHICQKAIENVLDDMLRVCCSDESPRDIKTKIFRLWTHNENLLFYAFIYMRTFEKEHRDTNMFESPYKVDLDKLEKILNLCPSHSLDNVVKEWYAYFNIQTAYFLNI